MFAKKDQDNLKIEVDHFLIETSLLSKDIALFHKTGKLTNTFNTEL